MPTAPFVLRLRDVGVARVSSFASQTGFGFGERAGEDQRHTDDDVR